MKDVIFIHIPKTGGTTINTAMNNTFWQTTPDFNYRHIDSVKMKSNAGDIFQRRNIEKYKAYKVFTMLRDPVDRVISEFYFLQDREQFMKLFSKKPKTLEGYIENRQTHNGMLKFLQGERMYSGVTKRKVDLDEVLDCIDEIPVHIGLFEYFNESMEYFSDTTGIKWQKKLQAKRITFKRPEVSDLSPDLIERIKEANKLDCELYEFAKNNFLGRLSDYTGKSVSFDYNKYHHVIPYAYNYCLFEFWMNHKKYIKVNIDYFKQLTFFLLKEKKITDGYDFAATWINTYINKIKLQFPETNFTDLVSKAFESEEEPLKQLEQVAKAIDDFFEKNGSTEHRFYTIGAFHPIEVVEKSSSKGILSTLFRRFTS